MHFVWWNIDLNSITNHFFFYHNNYNPEQGILTLLLTDHMSLYQTEPYFKYVPVVYHNGIWLYIFHRESSRSICLLKNWPSLLQADSESVPTPSFNMAACRGLIGTRFLMQSCLLENALINAENISMFVVCTFTNKNYGHLPFDW